MIGLEDQVVVVTGGGSGIGLATLERLVAAGARVAAWDVARTDGFDELATAHPDQVHFAEVDVRSSVAIGAALEAVHDRFGPVTGLVAAAGVAGGGPAHGVPEEEWQRVIDINLTGTFLCAKAVLADMVEARRGSIVTIASVEGLEGAEGGSAYNASKAGVVNFTRNLAIDYGRLGIRANAICPGFIETPMFDAVLGSGGMAEVRGKIEAQHKLGRFGRPSEVAAAITFLLSDESSFVSGVALPVDGGYTAGHSLGLVEMMGLV